MSTPPFAEPFTPRGIAAFARGSTTRLLLAQGIIAMLAAAVMVWFVEANCFSTIQLAIQNLPDTGKISRGTLDWHDDNPKVIAEGRLLAVVVDLEHSGRIHSAADVQVEFGKGSVRLYSFLGYSELFYARAWPAPFNRTDLEPLWGAWAAEITALTAATAVISLLLSWAALATLYLLPAWLLGFFGNRDLTLAASWRLGNAALMPGALLMTAALVLYNIGFLNLITLAILFVAHFVVAWIYVVASIFFVPRLAGDLKGNPFEATK